MKKNILIALILISIISAFFYWQHFKKSGNFNNDYNLRVQQAIQEQNNQILEPTDISAWIAWWNDNQALESLNTNSKSLNTILPVWYLLDKNGHIVEDDRFKNKEKINSFATINHIAILPSITNEFDSDKISNLLNDEQLQTQQIESLASLAKTQGFKGWDLDLEEMYPGDQQGFSDFVAALANKLHQQNLFLSVTVQAKTGTSDDSPATQAEDWINLSKNADFIRIMAYDFHDETSDPGAITPLDKYEQVIKYALRTIPKDKLIIGLPTYGYDWSSSKGESLQFSDIITRLNENHVQPQRDLQSSELVANFSKQNIKHSIWYEDGESIKTKIIIAKSYGINKFTFWHLGGEDPNIWNNFKSN